MAQDFRFISLKKDLDNRHYNAKIVFVGGKRDYEIYTDAHLYYCDWLDDATNKGFSILDGEDYAFSGEVPYLRVNALNIRDRECEENLEKAILRFVMEECSEKT